MRDNIVEHKAGRAYTKLMFPLRGGSPRVFWILEERKDGWLAEPVRMWSDVPTEPQFLSMEEWTGSESLALAASEKRGFILE